MKCYCVVIMSVTAAGTNIFVPGAGIQCSWISTGRTGAVGVATEQEEFDPKVHSDFLLVLVLVRDINMQLVVLLLNPTWAEPAALIGPQRTECDAVKPAPPPWSSCSSSLVSSLLTPSVLNKSTRPLQGFCLF